MEEVIKILRVLSKHWLMLVIAPIVSMAVIYVLTKDQPRRYKSEAKLYLNLQENQATSLNGEGLKQYQVHTYFQNINELIKSKRTLARTKLFVLENGLEGEGVLSSGLPEGDDLRQAMITRLTELKEGSLTPNINNSVDSLILSYFEYHKLSDSRMIDMVSTSRMRESNYLGFSLEEELPQKAQIVAMSFIDALIEENKYLAKNQIKGHKNLLEELLKKAKLDLDTKVARLENYKVSNSIINLSEHTKAIVTYLVQIEAERAKLNSTIAASQKGKREVLQTASAGNELTIDVSQNAEIVQLKQELKALNRQNLLASLNNNSLEALPQIEARIERTKEDLSNKLVEMSDKQTYDPTRIQLELANRYLSYDLDEEMSKDILNVVDEEINRVQSYAKRFAPFESTIGTYDREIGTAQNVYLTLLNKLSVAQSMEYGSGENEIEVIDAPDLPEKPLASKRVILVAAGGMAILVLIAGTLVLLTLLDRSIATVSDYEREGTMPVLAAIPALTEGSQKEAKIIHDQQVIAVAKGVRGSAKIAGNVLLLLSGTDGTGKSYLAEQIKLILDGPEYQVAILNANPKSEASEVQIDLRSQVDENKILRNETQLMKEVKQASDQSDLVLLLVSPADHSSDFKVWLEHYPHFLYLYKAGRIFSKSDHRLEKVLSDNKYCSPGMVLSHTAVENMEDLVGEVPKRRSMIRVIIKKLLTRNLQPA
ncbi:MAG: Wzz/FepE/Etk N-terminal domain-containing protein [Cyclobacteriaceae bacterium]